MPESDRADDRIGGMPESAPVQQTPRQLAQARPLEQQGDARRREAERGEVRPDHPPRDRRGPHQDPPAPSGTEEAGGLAQMRG